ncbi:ferredoxin--NADP reductase [Pandoraea sputorum]|uniref:ferredoxin--NADP reductase n=1 Tax=Pandoraea sputorum TaxID=93222 RepID=UPI002AF6A1FE|nr:ferredoxin--NADP reductase [Pandoraea sputorum]
MQAQTKHTKYSPQTVTGMHFWTPTIFSIKTTRPPGLQFTAGQFVRLGLPGDDGELIWRAYSFVNSPAEDTLEFYVITIPEGQLTPRLSELKVGDELFVDHTAYGFLTLDRFTGGDDLWLLATGTGLAPFVSILRDPEVWHRFKRIFVVHSVRWERDLAYYEELRHFSHPDIDPALVDKLHFAVSVTREQTPGALYGRITSLLASGELEKAVGATLDPATSRIMVCGNPDMIKELRAWFTGNGYAVSRTATPGPLVLEKQW